MILFYAFTFFVKQYSTIDIVDEFEHEHKLLNELKSLFEFVPRTYFEETLQTYFSTI